jgi:hypothetical protein
VAVVQNFQFNGKPLELNFEKFAVEIDYKQTHKLCMKNCKLIIAYVERVQ